MKSLMRIFFLAIVQVFVVNLNLQAQGWQLYWGSSVFVSLSAVNDSVCWFAGDKTCVIRLTVHSDGSYNISEVPGGIDVGDALMAICGRSASLAWVGSADGKLYRTTNGGIQWVKQYTHASAAFIDGIYFWTNDIGIAFGDPIAFPGTGPFTMLRTTDGGTHWNDISSSLPSVTAQSGLTEDFDVAGSHFWFTSTSSGNSTVPRHLFHSRDRGLTWEDLNVPQNFGDFEVAFSDTLNGLATNSAGKTARTTDGGKTWSVSNSGVGWLPLKGEKGTGNFWVGGNFDNQNKTYPIFYSSDFGSTWAKQPTISPLIIMGLSVSSGNVVWACGWNYLAMRNASAKSTVSVSSHAGDPSGLPWFELQQNYPNPFNPATTIKYYVREQGATKLQVFDVAGREVRTLVNGNQSKGWHIVLWDGTDDHHQSVATGIYFYRIESNGLSEAKKMVLLR